MFIALGPHDFALRRSAMFIALGPHDFALRRSAMFIALGPHDFGAPEECHVRLGRIDQKTKKSAGKSRFEFRRPMALLRSALIVFRRCYKHCTPPERR